MKNRGSGYYMTSSFFTKVRRYKHVSTIFGSFALIAIAAAVYAYSLHRPPFIIASADAKISVHRSIAPARQIPATTTGTNAYVIRAVDGDTLLVNLDGEKGEWRIRLLGVNTPETVDPRKPVECFGKEASAHMHALVDGKRVRLEGDPQADERDTYDRLLRNVFLEDGTDVNAAMVRDGFAYAYLFFPLDRLRKRELKILQDNAKLTGQGIWNPDTCNGKP